MELKQDVHVTEKSGEFNGKAFGINEENIHLVLEAFQKNIYSNPIGSIVREITSNCIDSHIEANQTKDIEIEYVKSSVIYGAFESIIFRDFGVGLSPERIEAIFTNYFSSTKRTDNKQLGGFGIGSKSPFSYTDTYYINTVSNGKLYNYISYKEQKGDRLDLIGQPSEYLGNIYTEIVIPLRPTDINRFIGEIRKQLTYIKNIKYIGFSDYIFNPVNVIYEDDDMLVTDQREHSNLHIINGKIPYPIDYNILGLSEIRLNIGLKFNIGELSVSISRESLQYDDATKALILSKIDKLKKSCANQLILDLQNKDYNIIEYYKNYHSILNGKNMKNYHSFYIKDNDTFLKAKSLLGNENINFTELNKFKDIDLYSNIEETFVNISFLKYDASTFIKKETSKGVIKIYDSLSMATSYLDLPIYLIKDKTSHVINSQLIKNNPNGFITVKIPELKEKDLTGIFRNKSKLEFFPDLQSLSVYRDKIIEELLPCTLNYEDVIIDKIEDGFDEANLDYKQIRKIAGKIFYKELNYVNYDYVFNQKETTIQYFLDYSDNLPLIYGFSEDDEKLKTIGKYFNTKVIKIAKNVEKYFKKGMYVDDFVMNDSKQLRDFYTSYKLNKILEVDDNLSYLVGFESLNIDIFNKYEKIKDFIKNNSNSNFNDPIIKEILVICEKQDFINQDIIDIFDELVLYTKDLKLLYLINDLKCKTLKKENIDLIREFLILKGKKVN